MMFSRRRQAALTLIELLVVMVILVILAGSITFYVANKADQAKISRAKADIYNISQALDSYRVALGDYPTTEQGLMALFTPPSGANADKWRQGGGPFVKMQNFNDPWGHAYEYQSPGTDGREFQIVSNGPDGKSGSDKAIRSWELNGPNK